jgi:hypothetical protein
MFAAESIVVTSSTGLAAGRQFACHLLIARGAAPVP